MQTLRYILSTIAIISGLLLSASNHELAPYGKFVLVIGVDLFFLPDIWRSFAASKFVGTTVIFRLGFELLSGSGGGIAVTLDDLAENKWVVYPILMIALIPIVILHLLLIPA